MSFKQVIHGNKFPIKCWADDIEPHVVQQLKDLAGLPFIYKHVAVMPDVHGGNGFDVVGSVIATTGAVIPSAVGVDIGCGMCAVPTNLTANDMPSSLATLRSDIEAAVPVGFHAHPNESHLTHDEIYSLEDAKTKAILEKHNVKEGKANIFQQLGTLGGGNHFIEICLDETGRVWIMLHSGSRGIGNKIGSKFIELAMLDMQRHFINLPNKGLAYIPEGTEYFDDYITTVSWAQRYAALNRKVMLRRICEVMKKHFPQIEIDLEGKAINCHHNYISTEHHFGHNCLVTRKGAVRARKGDLGIIPGSMGTRSYIVEGLGNEDSFHSCSHGAGRKMSRKKAAELFSIEDHIKATEGVECRKDEKVLDETPMAYKDIDQVMENQSDLVKPVHVLKQILCIKG